MSHQNELYIHEPDIAWIIALYKAIYGGDPGPIEVNEPTALAAAALASQLAATNGNSRLTFGQLQERLGKVGIGVTRGQAPKTETLDIGDPKQPLPPPVVYCFEFDGVEYCVRLPRVTTRLLE